jgi:spore coat polysaccharide biosynthesis predicted glycosyltransferase SpsG
VRTTQLGKIFKKDHSTIVFYKKSHQDQIIYQDYREMFYSMKQIIEENVEGCKEGLVSAKEINIAENKMAKIQKQLEVLVSENTLIKKKYNRLVENAKRANGVLSAIQSSVIPIEPLDV